MSTASPSVDAKGAIVVGCSPAPGAKCARATVVNADWSGRDLSGIDLSSATLLNTNLSGAILNRADLSTATVMQVNLTGTSLRGADLRDAVIASTDLSVAITGPKTTCPNGEPGPCS